MGPTSSSVIVSERGSMGLQHCANGSVLGFEDKSLNAECAAELGMALIAASTARELRK